jgi:hypothetical protein
MAATADRAYIKASGGRAFTHDVLQPQPALHRDVPPNGNYPEEEERRQLATHVRRV